jgi:hypothetical protein
MRLGRRKTFRHEIKVHIKKKVFLPLRNFIYRNSIKFQMTAIFRLPLPFVALRVSGCEAFEVRKRAREQAKCFGKIKLFERKNLKTKSSFRFALIESIKRNCFGNASRPDSYFGLAWLSSLSAVSDAMARRGEIRWW